MLQKTILGFSGKKSSGKDTAVNDIAKRLPFGDAEVLPFAAGLKDIETTVAAGLLKLKFKKSGLQEAIRKAFAAQLGTISHQRGDGR